MKKKLLPLLALLLTAALALTACGGSAAPAPADPTPAPQNDEEPAQPEEPGCVMELVEINMDNWQEYFELVAVESPAYYYLTNMGVSLDTARYFEYELRLKDEYAEQYQAHGSYEYPKVSGIPVEAVNMLTASGEAQVEEEIAVTFTYAVKADAQFINRILCIPTENFEGEAEITGEGSLKKGAYLRYLLAKDNSFEEDKNDSFLHVFAPLPKTFTIIANGEDLSRYGWIEELSEAFISEIMEITITDISGTIPVWVEKLS